MFLGANLFVTTSDTKQTSIRVLLAPAGARGCVSSLQTPKLCWFYLEQCLQEAWVCSVCLSFLMCPPCTPKICSVSL